MSWKAKQAAFDRRSQQEADARLYRRGPKRYTYKSHSVMDSFTSNFPMNPTDRVRTVIFLVRDRASYETHIKPRLKEHRCLPMNSGWVDRGMAANFMIKEFIKVQLILQEGEDYILP